MDTFNSNNAPLDCSFLENMFLEKGVLKSFSKNDYLLRQGDKARHIGYVATGFFRLSRIDTNGNEWIIGYSFEHDFVCDYPAMIQNKEASINIQASTDCTVYLFSFGELNDFWETDMNTQRLGRNIAETMFSEIAQRLYSFYNTDKYYFFDLKSRSLKNVKDFAEHEHLDNRIIIRNCDSTKGVLDLLPTLPKTTFLHIDPYEIDVKGIDGHSYFDIFVQATQLGMKCLLWYGFMTLDDMSRLDKHIASCLQKADIQNNVIGSKLIMNNIEKDAIAFNPGVLGSGLLASNLSDKSNCQLLDFTRLLVEVYKNSQYKGQDGSVYCVFKKLHHPLRL